MLFSAITDRMNFSLLSLLEFIAKSSIKNVLVSNAQQYLPSFSFFLYLKFLLNFRNKKVILFSNIVKNNAMCNVRTA